MSECKRVNLGVREKVSVSGVCMSQWGRGGGVGRKGSILLHPHHLLSLRFRASSAPSSACPRGPAPREGLVHPHHLASGR